MKHAAALTVLVSVIVLALVALLVNGLPDLWRLNQTALWSAGLMTRAGAGPDWWMAPATPTASLCQQRPGGPLANGGPAMSSSPFADRMARFQGIIALACGERDQAAALFQDAMAADDADPSLRLLLGVASASATEPAGGDGLAGSANWGVALEQARKAFDQGDAEAAALQLDAVQAAIAEPAHVDRRSLYFWACFIYRGARKLPSSLSACQRLVEVSPDSKEAWNSLGLTLFAQRNWPDAEQAYARAVALDNRWTTALVNLGRSLVAQDRAAEAHPFFETVLTIDAGEPWSSYYLAIDALAAGQCQLAQTYAQAAVRAGNARLARDAQRLLDRDLPACK